MSQKVDDHRFVLKGKEHVPIITGGMGVNISTSALALAIARLGGIGHISDAMSPFLSDSLFGTNYQAEKGRANKHMVGKTIKEGLKWSYEVTYKASMRFFQKTMEAKRNSAGSIWVNVMEKLGMGDPKETLRARLNAAMDAGLEGITLSAGLHNATLNLIETNKRFRDVNLGIITSSVRALRIFLRSAKRIGRMPDYVIVEGPLAGGHLGFGLDWKKYDLKAIVFEVLQFLKQEDLKIPVIPAGGVFTGTDACNYLTMGAAAVQVATRFTIAKECGLPEKIQQEYLKAEEGDVEVNMSSPTGYPMRMLKSSPSLRSNQRPNCEPLGYILDAKGRCQYLDVYEKAQTDPSTGRKKTIVEKMCICTHFMKFNCYTCGHYVYRLKETTTRLSNGSFYLPGAEQIFNDYLHSVEHKIVQAEPKKVLATTTYPPSPTKFQLQRTGT